LHVIVMNSPPRISVLLDSLRLSCLYQGISTLYWGEKGSPFTIKLVVYDNGLGILSSEEKGFI
jgi:hypothetical protein